MAVLAGGRALLRALRAQAHHPPRLRRLHGRLHRHGRRSQQGGIYTFLGALSICDAVVCGYCDIDTPMGSEDFQYKEVLFRQQKTVTVADFHSNRCHYNCRPLYKARDAITISAQSAYDRSEVSFAS